MKKDMVVGLTCGVIVGLLVGVLATVLMKPKSAIAGSDITAIPFALDQAEELNDTILAKVENIAIPISDFSNAYEAVQRTLPPQQLAVYKQQEGAFKAEVLETMINQYVTVAQALKEGFLDDPENMRAMQGAMNAALQQLYVSKNIPTNANAFAPSTPEIDQAYRQYGTQMRAQGMSAQQSRDYIVTQISQQKQQVWMAGFMRKIREGYRVERNTAVIEAQGISTNPLDLIPGSAPGNNAPAE
ncbi:MAG: hypothetical protein ACRCY4_04550 [Brevinema sp.]